MVLNKALPVHPRRKQVSPGTFDAGHLLEPAGLTDGDDISGIGGRKIHAWPQFHDPEPVRVARRGGDTFRDETVAQQLSQDRKFFGVQRRGGLYIEAIFQGFITFQEKVQHAPSPSLVK